MSAALQIALFVASVAFVALVACLIPIAFQARRQLEQLVSTAGQLKADVDVLVQEGRELVRSANTLVTRASEQLHDVENVVRTVRQWKDRADRLVNQVGAAIEPPVFSLARNMNLFRLGVTTLLQILSCRNHRSEIRSETPSQTKEE